ncbi:bestrophin family ion channel [Shigella flexneri]
MLPFALVVDLHYMTPFISCADFLHFYFAGLSGRRLEDPFGTENNDFTTGCHLQRY